MTELKMVRRIEEEVVSNRRRNVGVVIGGGGIKPLAVLPLFDFLDKAGIGIDLLVGCSGGGIMAALRGAGHDSAQIQELVARVLTRKLFRNVDYRSVASIAKLPFGRFDRSAGLLKRKPFLRAFRRLFGDLNLEDFPTKTVLQATDFQTGDGLALETGLAAHMVYASAAMFPVLPPLFVGGKWLVDGGFSAPVPVIEAVRRDVGVIIVVVFQEKLAEDPQGFIECFWSVPKTFERSLLRSQISLSIDLHHSEMVVINVPFEKYIQIWDIDEVPSILQAGQRAVDDKKDEILSLTKPPG
jgi:NTE family protein